MAGDTKIEWCSCVWNPVRGCSRTSPGCTNCYAERSAHEMNYPGGAYEGLIRMTSRGPVWNGEIRLLPERLEAPLRWRKPQRVFVNSMSDLFHESIPEAFIQRVFDTMRRAHWHQFQVLTKRSERLLDLDSRLDWPQNVWQGVSVEHDAYGYRADDLRKTGARIKFLSVEPLIGSVSSLSVEGLDWVIVGGESGPGARPMNLDWAREVRDKCQSAGVALFVKQLGGEYDKRGGDDAVLDGRRWTEYPDTESQDEQNRLFA